MRLVFPLACLLLALAAVLPSAAAQSTGGVSNTTGLFLQSQAYAAYFGGEITDYSRAIGRSQFGAIPNDPDGGGAAYFGGGAGLGVGYGFSPMVAAYANADFSVLGNRTSG